MENADVLNEIKKLRVRHAPRGAAEFKWGKVSTNFLPIYQDLLDVFFDGLKNNKLRYVCLVLDTRNKEVVKHKNYRKEGYFKLYYQLFLHKSKKAGIYRIRPDNISTTNPALDFEELRRCLDGGLKKKIEGRVVVMKITPIDSKTSNMIQLVDVVTGLLACALNDHYKKKDASKAKTALMRYFLARAERDGYITMVDDDTIAPKRSDIFDLWLFRPKST